MLAGIWRLSGLSSSQQAASPTRSPENNTDLHQEYSDPVDPMEAQQYGNGHLGSEGAGTGKGKKRTSESKTKKSKKRSTRARDDAVPREGASSDSNGNVSAPENGAAAHEVNGQDPQSALQVLEDMARSAKKSDDKSPKTKKSAKRAARLATHNGNGDEEYIAVDPRATSEDLAELPKKMKKAKKAKSRKLSGASRSRHQEDINGPEDALLQPLTPAHQSHRPVEEFLDERIPESSLVEQEYMEVESEADHGDTQVLSQKASGKRKAVDEDGGQQRKKRARKSTSNQKDLRSMFQPVNGPDNTHQQATDRSDNQADEDMQDAQRELPFGAAVLRASEMRKRRKRRLPVDDDDTIPSSNSRRVSGTPRATAPRTPRSLVNSIGTPSGSALKTSLTAADADGITRAIENYRDFNNVTQRHVNELIQLSALAPDSRALWTTIYEEVPLLPRRNVQQFVRRNFHNYEGRGIWSEEQDEELREAYQRKPNKWTAIGQELNRFPEDVRDRWRNYLVCEGNMKRDTWDFVEVEQLKTAVEECIQAIRDEKRWAGAPGVSSAEEERLIDWQTVSEKMNHTRSRLQCSYKWKRLKDFDGSDDEKGQPVSHRAKQARLEIGTLSSADKLRLLHAVQESGATRPGKIPWGTLSRELSEKGKRMIWKVCISELAKRLPGSADMEFKDAIECLVDIFEKSAPDEPEGFDITAPLEKAKKEKEKRKSKAKSNGKSKNAVRASENGEGPSSKSNTSRKFKDRMRRQDESTPEPGLSAGSGKAVETGDAEDVLRTDQRTRQKGKPKKFLSDERVVEDLSEEEDALNEQTDQQPSDAGDGYDDNSAESPGAEPDATIESEDNRGVNDESGDLEDSDAASTRFSDDDGHSAAIEDAPAPEDDEGDEKVTDIENEDEAVPESDEEIEPAPEEIDESESAPGSNNEDEKAPESDDETQSIDPDEDHAITTNGFEKEGSEAASSTRGRGLEGGEVGSLSPDTGHNNKTPYHRLANRHVETFFDIDESDSESAHSSGSSASSIPARVARDTSIEL